MDVVTNLEITELNAVAYVGTSVKLQLNELQYNNLHRSYKYNWKACWKEENILILDPFQNYLIRLDLLSFASDIIYLIGFLNLSFANSCILVLMTQMGWVNSIPILTDSIFY